MLFIDVFAADILCMRRKLNALKMVARGHLITQHVRVPVAYSLATYAVSFSASGFSKNNIHPGVWHYKLSL
jgi:hypothetical protein